MLARSAAFDAPIRPRAAVSGRLHGHDRRAASFEISTLTVALVAILSLAVASPAVAQTRGVAPRPGPFVDALAALDPGAVVRLRVGRHLVQGIYERDTATCLVLHNARIPDGLTLDPCEDDDGAAFFVPAAAVERIQERGNGAGRGALIGAIIGGAGAAIYGGLLAYAYGSDFGEEAGAVVGLGVIGAGGGALLGAALGWPVERWHTRYRRSP